MHTKENRKESGALDAFRLIAAVLVITIHTSPLESYNASADFFLTRILARIAVPFFFMVTGQFIAADFFTSSGTGKFVKEIKKLCFLYGIAILLYLPLGIYAGYYKNLTFYGVIRMLLFDGTFYHLWYFPACIVGLLIVYGLSRFLPLRGVTVIAGILYLFGLLGDSYYGLAEQIPLIKYLYTTLFHAFSYTRNGLFFAPLFLVLGVWLSDFPERDIDMRKTAWTGLGISFAMMTAEGFLLRAAQWQRHDSMYVMLVPVMYFLYQVLLGQTTEEHPLFRKISLWSYILHPAVIVAVRGTGKFLHLTDLLTENSLVHFLAVTAVSFLAAALLAKVECHMADARAEKRGKKEPFATDRAWIEVDLNALEKNVRFLQSQLPDGCELMPAVKAEAYGHGAVLVSKELNRLGIRAFCVACVEEAVKLRRYGIEGEILILGYTHPEQFPLLRRYHLTQTVVDYEYAVMMNTCGEKFHVHIGIDTGMHRLGERSENLERICRIFEMKNLEIDGIFTHLSADDTENPEDIAFTRKQARTFYEILEVLQLHEYSIPKVHLLSSYGVLNYPELAGDYARVGIALYGVLSTKEDTEKWADKLTPVLSLKARVASVRDLHKYEPAGYGRAFTALSEMKIATITIGYADGLPRNLSGGAGAVLIRGQRAPVIGRICMDQTIVDVTGIPEVKAGDTAVLIGRSGGMQISAAEVAEEAGTITNEILSRLGKRLRRKVV